MLMLLYTRTLSHHFGNFPPIGYEIWQPQAIRFQHSPFAPTKLHVSTFIHHQTKIPRVTHGKVFKNN